MVVPAKTRFKVNRLTVPGETVESVIEDMEELVASLNLEAEVEVNTKPPLYASYMMERTGPIVEMFDSVYRKVHGVEPHYEYSSSINDTNTFAGEGGIPCIHLGPYAGDPHQKMSTR